MSLEDMMRRSVELLRERRPTWAVSFVTRDAIIDADNVTEDRRDVHRLPPDEVRTTEGGDGFKDSNPDTGAGELPGDLTVTVNEHRFGEGAMSVFDTPEAMADHMEAIAAPTAPATPEETDSEGGS